MVAAAKVHTFFGADADHIIRLHAVKSETTKQRRNTLHQVGQLIKAKFGSRYSVVDASPGRYCTNLEQLPFELGIVDAQISKLIEPGNSEAIPEIYDYHQVPLLEAFKSKGYSVLPPIIYPSQVYNALLPPLHISAPGRPFFVHPPSPFSGNIETLVKAYTELVPSLPNLLALLHLWLQSHNLNPDISSSCLVVMTIGFLQNRYGVPKVCSDNAVASLFERSNWWIESLSVPASDSHSVPGPTSSPLDVTLAELMEGWLQFWSAAGGKPPSFNSKLQLVSLLQNGGILQRTTLKVSTLRSTDTKPTSPTMQVHLCGPATWKAAPFIVQDPFLVTHNHASHITKETLDRFAQTCRISMIAMRATLPLHVAVFGASFTPLLGPGSTSPPRDFPRPKMSKEINRMYQSSQPSREVLQLRQYTMQRISNAISGRFGPKYTLECFGSTRYGVDSENSDLDMVILDSERINGFAPWVDIDRLPTIYNMRAVGRALQQQGFDRVLPIVGATVPIVKFHDPQTDMLIDINCNDQLGLINTLLLRSYCEIYPHLRPLIFFIKKWAKSMGLNDPSGAHGLPTPSSYCLALMTIGYLQHIGALPNLQARSPTDPVPNQSVEGFWLRTVTGDRLWCDTRFRSAPEEGWEGYKPTLFEAALGWFRYWGREHAYDDNLVSVRFGGVMPRQCKYLQVGENDTGMPKKRNKKSKKQKLKEAEGQNAAAPAGTVAVTSSELPAGGTKNIHSEPLSIDAPSMGMRDQARQASEKVEAQAEINTRLEEANLLEDAVQEAHEVEQGMGDEGVNEAASEEDELEIGGNADEEPMNWKSGKLVIADPFISVKNVAASCKPKVIARLRQECDRVASYLESGAPLESIFGPGDERVFGGQPRRRPAKPMGERPPRTDKQPANDRPRMQKEKPSPKAGPNARPTSPRPTSPAAPSTPPRNPRKQREKREPKAGREANPASPSTTSSQTRSPPPAARNTPRRQRPPKPPATHDAPSNNQSPPINPNPRPRTPEPSPIRVHLPAGNVAPRVSPSRVQASSSPTNGPPAPVVRLPSQGRIFMHALDKAGVVTPTFRDKQ